MTLPTWVDCIGQSQCVFGNSLPLSLLIAGIVVADQRAVTSEHATILTFKEHMPMLSRDRTKPKKLTPTFVGTLIML